MKPDRFRHFAAIDWSGAAGERHKGIAIALCSSGDTAPELVRPSHRWSRPEVLNWLLECLPPDTLVGFDMGISLAFADVGAFLPGWEESPADAKGLWALVDAICDGDPHLGASSFVDHEGISPHFRRHGGREGLAFGGGRGRFRVTERVQEGMGCKPYSNFNLVGAAQVGKSSLTGMRLLHRVNGRLPVWPIDMFPSQGSVLCEIYTTIAAMAAGRSASRSKIRDGADLDTALARLGSQPAKFADIIEDHKSDAIITSAWLRLIAHKDSFWHPDGLNPKIAQTEGWTFGAR
jgi:hypothetical protein